MPGLGHPYSALFDAVAELLAHRFDGRKRLRVVHPGGAQHTDRSEMLSVDHDGGDHDRAGRQLLHPMFDADGHRHATVDDVAHERDHHELLLERGEHRSDDLDGIKRVGDCGSATRENLIGTPRRSQSSERSFDAGSGFT